MASVRKETIVHARAEEVWDAIRDIGAIHTRLARRFVTKTELQGDSRLVTFANGAVVRERIVNIEDDRWRLAYAVVEGRTTNHSASIQVFDAVDGLSRLVWIPTSCPTSLADLIDVMMTRWIGAMKETLEASRAIAVEASASA